MVDRAERVISSGKLEQLTMEELVATYNKTKPRPKKKEPFSSVAEAVRVILERLVEIERRKPSRKPSPVKHGRPREPLRIDKKPARRKGKSRQIRRSTNREILVRMLRRGATLEQIELALDLTRKQARESIRQLCRDLGYGVEQLADEILKLIE